MERRLLGKKDSLERKTLWKEDSWERKTLGKERLFGKKEISKEIKTQVYQKILRLSLIYGSEPWMLSKRNKSKVKAMEMRFLKSIKGITRRDNQKHSSSGRTKYSVD